MNNINSNPNLPKVINLLDKFNDLCNQSLKTGIYNSDEITNTVRTLHNMKISDQFHLSELTEEQQETLSHALIVYGKK